MTEQATKTIGLTIGERIKAISIVTTFKGNIDTYAFALDDAKILSVTEKEWEDASLVKTIVNPDAPKNEQKETWNWNEPVELKECELHQSVIDFMVKSIKEKSDANEIGLDEGTTVSLYKKLI